jgi:anti-sigma B factor antagonist
MQTDSLSRFDVQRQIADGATCLSAAGELDASNTEPLRSALAAAIDTSAADATGPIILDLTGLSFIDSEGLGTLISGQKRARERGCRLCIVVSHPRIRRVFQLIGLTQVLNTYQTLEAAIAGRHTPTDAESATV